MWTYPVFINMHKTVLLAEEEEGRAFYFLSAWAMKTIWQEHLREHTAAHPTRLVPAPPCVFHPQW